MVAAGATSRVGASAGVKIVQQARGENLPLQPRGLTPPTPSPSPLVRLAGPSRETFAESVGPRHSHGRSGLQRSGTASKSC